MTIVLSIAGAAAPSETPGHSQSTTQDQQPATPGTARPQRARSASRPQPVTPPHRKPAISLLALSDPRS